MCLEREESERPAADLLQTVLMDQETALLHVANIKGEEKSYLRCTVVLLNTN